MFYFIYNYLIYMLFLLYIFYIFEFVLFVILYFFYYFVFIFCYNNFYLLYNSENCHGHVFRVFLSSDLQYMGYVLWFGFRFQPCNTLIRA